MKPAGASAIEPWYLDNLVCPIDRGPLRSAGDHLVSATGRKYPVVNGIPVMLVGGIAQTLWVADASRLKAWEAVSGPGDCYCLDSLGVSAEEVQQLREFIPRSTGSVDPVVSFLVGATNGIAYRHLIGRLQEYPIPELRLPPGNGRTFLDVGCGWGRWCVAAGRKGYLPVGIDPSLGAVLAARRVAQQLGVPARFIVGDARHLPLRSGSIDVGFSYSVIQHFSRADAATAVEELARVLKPGATAFVQMPTVLGSRCLYHQLLRGFREGTGFDVRYWTPPALRRLFTTLIGPTRLSVDCFFGIGLQRSDLPLLSWYVKPVLLASEALRHVSRVLRPLVYLADSVYVTSNKSLAAAHSPGASQP